VKRLKGLTTILCVAVLISMSGCGTSDSIKSLLLTSTGSNNSGFYNLVGQDGTIQLKVYAVYNSGKMIDVTNASTWTMVPIGCVVDPVNGTDADPCAPEDEALPAAGPNTITINPTGMATGIAPICTWFDLIVTTGTPPNTVTAPANPAQWVYTGFYQTTATYRNFTSQPVAIGVGVTVSNSPNGGCGPS
jgi:hypothetical protein